MLAGVGLGALLDAERVVAAEGPVTIEWRAPAGCPSYADVASWLDAVLPPEVEQRLEQARAVVVIERTPSNDFRAEVSVTAGGDSEGRVRTLEGPSCDELARSAVIVVSVALTEAVAEKKAPEPEPAPAPPAPVPAAPVVPPTAPPPVQPPATPAPVPPSAVIGVAAGVSSGFGDPALRLDAFVRFLPFDPGSLAARLRVVPLGRVETSDGDVDLLLAAASPGLCVSRSAARTLHFGACLQPELGIVRAEGPSGLDDSAAWLAVGAQPFLEWGTTIRLYLAADADVRLLRPTLELADGQKLAELPRFALSALLGLSVAVP